MDQQKVILVILDGLGFSPISEANAVQMANLPVFFNAFLQSPHTLLKASGDEVGLTYGEMGNSEVGHINLGSGRVVEQDLTRINKSIADKSFFANKELIASADFVKKHNSRLHIYGLASDGGVHAHIDHMLALVDFAKEKGVKNLYFHLITDGRDMPAKSAGRMVDKLTLKLKQTGLGKIATLCGRFYAMDRDKNWDRTQKAYELIAFGKGEVATDPKQALEAQYKKGENDENLSPILIDKDGILKNNDAVICTNYRVDRTSQIAKALINLPFDSFNRGNYPKVKFTGFVSYGNEPNEWVRVAYFAQEIKNQVASLISSAKLKQLHAAETEKYAHVTYFFNGGTEKPFAGEERVLVPSPKVETYDKKPDMSAMDLTSKFIAKYTTQQPDFALINFANPDMVGHTGNLKAAISAVETVDKLLGKIIELAQKSSAVLIITADHGNCEQMKNPQTNEIDKEHTTNPVPFCMVKPDLKLNLSAKVTEDQKLQASAITPVGVLADTTASIIDILKLKKSSEITGQSLNNII